MKKLMTMAQQFRGDRGAPTLEYFILLGIIAVAWILSIIGIGIWVNGTAG